MKRTLVILALIFVACSDDESGFDGGDAKPADDSPVIVFPDTGSGNDVTQPPTDSGTETGTDSGGTSDAAAPTSNPGKISCTGGSECTASSETCCGLYNPEAGAISYACATTCSGGGAIACDEKADCSSGTCCYTPTALPFASCKSGGCKGSDVQLCKTTAECTSGTCQTYSCPTIKLSLAACAKPSGCL